jgi:hypothetical protein
MQKSENRQTQMFAMVEELYQSRMTRGEFCQQKGISKNCFYYWQKKYRQRATMEQPGFVSVRTGKESFVSNSVSRQIVLSYPNGVSLQLPAGIPLSVISSLLRLAWSHVCLIGISALLPVQPADRHAQKLWQSVPVGGNGHAAQSDVGGGFSVHQPSSESHEIASLGIMADLFCITSGLKRAHLNCQAKD